MDVATVEERLAAVPYFTPYDECLIICLLYVLFIVFFALAVLDWESEARRYREQKQLHEDWDEEDDDRDDEEFISAPEDERVKAYWSAAEQSIRMNMDAEEAYQEMMDAAEFYRKYR